MRLQNIYGFMYTGPENSPNTIRISVMSNGENKMQVANLLLLGSFKHSFQSVSNKNSTDMKIKELIMFIVLSNQNTLLEKEQSR